VHALPIATGDDTGYCIVLPARGPTLNWQTMAYPLSYGDCADEAASAALTLAVFTLLIASGDNTPSSKNASATWLPVLEGPAPAPPARRARNFLIPAPTAQTITIATAANSSTIAGVGGSDGNQ
jgi:hypothetical protein